MNTNHIPILLEVCLCSSINKAAQNLFMSQPQISHIIRSAEEEAGFPIFHRTRSGVTATPQGMLYLESLRIISVELEKISSIPAQFAEQKDISVAVVYSRFLMQTFLDFQEQVPVLGVTDCFMEGMYDSVIDQVVSRRVRIGILFRFMNLPGMIARQLERYGLEIIPLYEGIPVLAFMSRNHPLARNKRLSLQQLSEAPTVYFHGQDLEFLEELLHRKTNLVQLLVDDRASLLAAVDSGKYISISNTSSEHMSQADKYTYLPVEGLNYLSQACCIKPKLYTLTTREKQLLQFVKKALIKCYGQPL